MTIRPLAKGNFPTTPHPGQGLANARQAVNTALKQLPVCANADLGEDVVQATKEVLAALRKLEEALYPKPEIDHELGIAFTDCRHPQQKAKRLAKMRERNPPKPHPYGRYIGGSDALKKLGGRR